MRDKNQPSAEGKSRGAGRTRVFAFLAYPDSAPADWMDRLVEEHVTAYVSPLHDQDENPDGTPKKAHYHVLVLFDSVKTREQLDELRERVLGPNFNPKLENVNSTRGYARYLCHLDNPEKAQYDKAGVRVFGGGDYEEVISLPSDDFAMLKEIMAYLSENHVRYYSSFMLYCAYEREDWFRLLAQRYSYIIIEFIKAERQRHRDALWERQNGYVPGVNPETGEVYGGDEDDC